MKTRPQKKYPTWRIIHPDKTESLLTCNPVEFGEIKGRASMKSDILKEIDKFDFIYYLKKQKFYGFNEIKMIKELKQSIQQIDSKSIVNDSNNPQTKPVPDVEAGKQDETFQRDKPVDAPRGCGKKMKIYEDRYGYKIPCNCGDIKYSENGNQRSWILCSSCQKQEKGCGKRISGTNQDGTYIEMDCGDFGYLCKSCQKQRRGESQ